MISGTTSGIILSIIVLTIVIAISQIFGTQNGNFKKQENPQPGDFLADFNFFTKSEFPMVILTRNLIIRAVNESFLQLFPKAKPCESFQPFMDIEPLSLSNLLRERLNEIKSQGIFPEQPIFIGINLDILVSPEFDKIASCQRSSAYYVLIRKVSDLPSTEPLLALSLIDVSFTYPITRELIHKITEKESDLKKIEEIDRLKSEFLGTLSHELKTPLVSIRGYLDLMQSGKLGPLSEKQEKALRVSLKNTSHLNSLISSMLNFARMEAGKLKFDLANQKLQPHINDIIDSLRPMADNRNISIVSELEECLPAVLIDAALIHQVFSNLLENALKFSPSGSQIIIAARVEGNAVKVSVKDQGCGIPADKIGLIKTPFYQVDKSDTRPTSGLGLGLAISEKILTGHGTTLLIESEEYHGTVCSFMLKIATTKI